MKDLIHNNIPIEFPIMTLKNFLEYPLPPMENIVDPIIPVGGICTIFAKKGAGKTFFCMELACAVATGGDFIKWTVPKPCKVLYIEGETQSQATQKRLADIISRYKDTDLLENFFVFTPKFFSKHDDYMIDLDKEYDRKLVEEKILAEKFDLVFLDNLSSLRMSSNENESVDQNKFLAWIRRLRNKNISIIMICHEGKSNTDFEKKRSIRGSSKITDNVDTSINLSATKEPNILLVAFDKNRHIPPEEAQPFKVKYNPDFGWRYLEKYTDPKQVQENEIVKNVTELSLQGKKNREIAGLLDISESKVSRVLKASRIKNESNDLVSMEEEASFRLTEDAEDYE